MGTCISQGRITITQSISVPILPPKHDRRCKCSLRHPQINSTQHRLSLFPPQTFEWFTVFHMFVCPSTHLNSLLFQDLFSFFCLSQILHQYSHQDVFKFQLCSSIIYIISSIWNLHFNLDIFVIEIGFWWPSQYKDAILPVEGYLWKR